MDVAPIVSRLNDLALPGFSFAVRHGQTTVTGTGGNSSGSAVTTETAFFTASLAKPLAAVITMQQLAEGALRLTDLVTTWVPELETLRVWTGDGDLSTTVPVQQPITIHHLLTMTAGMGLSWADDPVNHALAQQGLFPGPNRAPISESEFLERLARIPLGSQPGEGWRYNTSSQVLTVVLTRVTGMELSDLVGSRVSGPLGLGSVSVPDSEFPALDGSLCCTPTDYLAILNEVVTPRTIPAEMAELIRTPALNEHQLSRAGGFLAPGCSYGLQGSVNLEDIPRRGHRGTYGWAGGSGCVALVDPAADLAAALFTEVPMTGPEGAPAFGAFFDGLAEAVNWC